MRADSHPIHHRWLRLSERDLVNAVARIKLFTEALPKASGKSDDIRP